MLWLCSGTSPRVAIEKREEAAPPTEQWKAQAVRLYASQTYRCWPRVRWPEADTRTVKAVISEIHQEQEQAGGACRRGRKERREGGREEEREKAQHQD
jgi:hypothetical protein